MSGEDRTARRYHWLSENAKNFVCELHNAIVGSVKREKALNMVAKTSEAARKVSVDLAKEPTRKLMNLIQSKQPPSNKNHCKTGFQKKKTHGRKP